MAVAGVILVSAAVSVLADEVSPTVEPISVATLVLAGVAVLVAVFWIAVPGVTAGTIAVDDDPMCT